MRLFGGWVRLFASQEVEVYGNRIVSLINALAMVMSVALKPPQPSYHSLSDIDHVQRRKSTNTASTHLQKSCLIFAG